MAILEPLKTAAIRLLGTSPSVFFTSSEQFQLELCDLINEVAMDICKYNDWQNLYKLYEFPTDGQTSVFDLPDDYDRMINIANIQDPRLFILGYPHVQNINDFQLLKNGGFVGLFGKAWCLYRNQIHFSQPPEANRVAMFPYISKDYALDTVTLDVNSREKSRFTADSDSFLIAGGERLLALGVIWRWRENKKLDYTGDQENFIMLLEQLAGKDTGSGVYRRSSRTRFFNAYYAWPFQLG